MTLGRASTGPDERHTISKMTSTKVEVQELNSPDIGPQVEEIASYSYVLQEEDVSSKPQNGMLIEEFSESEDKDNKDKKNDKLDKLHVNRGVSIVSVSDDDTTAKAISRDVSADDIHCFDLNDELNGNGDFHGNHEEIVEKRALYAETIIEERSIDESLADSSERKKSISNDTVKQKQNAILEKDKLSRQSSVRNSITEETIVQNGKSSSFDKEEKLSRQSSIREKSLSRQSSKLERLSSVESIKQEIKTLSRENSMKGTKTDGDEEEDEDMKKLFERIKRQRSVLDEILDKEDKKGEISDETNNVENGGKFKENNNLINIQIYYSNLLINCIEYFL